METPHEYQYSNLVLFDHYLELVITTYYFYFSSDYINYISALLYVAILKVCIPLLAIKGEISFSPFHSPFFYSAYVFVSMYACMCGCLCLCMHVQMSEVEIWCLPILLFTLFTCASYVYVLCVACCACICQCRCVQGLPCDASEL